MPFISKRKLTAIQETFAVLSGAQKSLQDALLDVSTLLTQEQLDAVSDCTRFTFDFFRATKNMSSDELLAFVEGLESLN